MSIETIPSVVRERIDAIAAIYAEERAESAVLREQLAAAFVAGASSEWRQYQRESVALVRQGERQQQAIRDAATERQRVTCDLLAAEETIERVKAERDAALHEYEAARDRARALAEQLAAADEQAQVMAEALAVKHADREVALEDETDELRARIAAAIAALTA